MTKVIFLTLTLLISVSSYANCLPLIEDKITYKEERLLFTKKKQKKVAIITGASVGGDFGVMTGGAAVAAENLDYDNKLLKKLYRKVCRRVDELYMEEMIDKIRIANQESTFCPNDGAKIYSFNKIKRHLRGEDYSQDLEADKIAITIEGEVEEIEFDVEI